MKCTAILKDDLVEEAARVTKIKGKTALLHAGLEALIATHARKRLVALGGNEKKVRSVPRRRSAS